MSNNAKNLFNATCPSNSEPYALQNLGDYMLPEFSENCIIIIDPAMPIHHQAYVVIDYLDELYFRQYFEDAEGKWLHCLNSNYPAIKLEHAFSPRGCVVQQKQRRQPSKHYYRLNNTTKQLDFLPQGMVKPIVDNFQT